ncbi:hypothetical protein MSAN_00786600 [Mycena sanguinolenta]|uniref:F-box domain-containing protein n=1 Tax=Mycena sanguinolenta TaxID=230812 RepID=A0A8H6YXX3_9AGAR|nr:hypothetical protein MSAN_00786600 [Mycena sanguinolenta]
MSLLQLPPEILEQILVKTSDRSPNTVAAVAACCRSLHDLVHSIWRDLFLANFDDPRPKNALKDSSPGFPGAPQIGYNWHNFTNRIGAANCLAAGDPACDFEALVDVVATAAPVPPLRTLDPVQRRRIVFPPLLRELNSTANTAWLARVLSRGYPPPLTKRMLASFDPDGSEYTRAEFEDTPMGMAFNKLTFLRGFIPIDRSQSSSTVEHQHATARAFARTRVYNTKYLMPERCWGPFQPLDPSQPHVYEWRNRLSRFTLPESDSQDADLALRSATSSSRRGQVFHPSSIVLAPSLLDLDEDIDDPDYDPDEDDSDDDDHHHIDGPHLLHFLSSRGIDFTDERTYPTYVFPAPHRVVPDYAFLAAARYIMEANMRDKFDMESHFSAMSSASKQAAADVGLELNEIVDAMQSLELTRMGGAPGFWDIWRPEMPEGDDDDDEPRRLWIKGKAKRPRARSTRLKVGTGQASGASGGELYAGSTTGTCSVCVASLFSVFLLIQPFLIVHNVDYATAGFGIDPATQETIRIFPMTLRVLRYERPPRPPAGADPRALMWRLPIIHIEGESRGTDTDETSARVVAGTVRMIGDGAVRWSMTSSEAAGADPEWVTESVQVGDIGSAIGFIGLWTGAEHSSTDPLGPCWAWKVA